MSLNRKSSYNTFICHLPTNQESYAVATSTLRVANKASQLILRPVAFTEIKEDDSYIIDLEKSIFKIELKMKDIPKSLNDQ